MKIYVKLFEEECATFEAINKQGAAFRMCYKKWISTEKGTGSFPLDKHKIQLLYDELLQFHLLLLYNV